MDKKVEKKKTGRKITEQKQIGRFKNKESMYINEKIRKFFFESESESKSYCLCTRA